MTLSSSMAALWSEQRLRGQPVFQFRCCTREDINVEQARRRDGGEQFEDYYDGELAHRVDALAALSPCGPRSAGGFWARLFTVSQTEVHIALGCCGFAAAYSLAMSRRRKPTARGQEEEPAVRGNQRCQPHETLLGLRHS